MRSLCVPLTDGELSRLEALARRDGRTRPAQARWLLLLALDWAERHPPRLEGRLLMGTPQSTKGGESICTGKEA